MERPRGRTRLLCELQLDDAKDGKRLVLCRRPFAVSVSSSVTGASLPKCQQQDPVQGKYRPCAANALDPSCAVLVRGDFPVQEKQIWWRPGWHSCQRDKSGPWKPIVVSRVWGRPKGWQAPCGALGRHSQTLCLTSPYPRQMCLRRGPKAWIHLPISPC